MSKRKKQPAPAVHSDLGTPERRRHGKFVMETVPAEMVSTKHRDRLRAVEVDDPLWQYRRAGTISRLQRDAGLKLRELWYQAGRVPMVIGAYQEMIASGAVASLPINSIDQYHKFTLAIRAVGLIASNEVITVCCMEERVARNRVAELRVGLTALARHFG